jgi:hypothetical protein
MATKKTDTVDAFVLVDCVFGKAGEVVTLSANDAAVGKEAGMLDLHPDAIKANRKTKE